MVYISTILLIANLIFLFFKENALFSFWHFLWMYPLEIMIYRVFFGGIIKIFEGLLD